MSAQAPEQSAALAEQAQRVALELAAVAAIDDLWAAVQPARALAQWYAGLGLRIFAIVALVQEALAARSTSFIEQFIVGDDLVAARVLPLALAGRSSEDRAPLEPVLRLAAVRLQQQVAAGVEEAKARESTRAFLEMVTRTEAADAGRAGDQAALIGASRVPSSAAPLEPAKVEKDFEYGWVRVLNPPSCSRCAILAGRFYKWNDGFERHENCDCIHLPHLVANRTSIPTDPRAYFDSLSPAEKTRQFGKAVSRAIEDGADMNRVVNAATKRKVRIASDGRRSVDGKPTVWQIIKDAGDDREQAARLLAQFGYIRG